MREASAGREEPPAAGISCGAAALGSAGSAAVVTAETGGGGKMPSTKAEIACSSAARRAKRKVESFLGNDSGELSS
jgi:hypothetical protein